MATPQGHEILAGIAKGTDWGTAVSLTPATDGILVLPGSNANLDAPPVWINESDQPWPRADATATGPINCEGRIIQVARYNDRRLMTYALGNGSNYSTPAQQTAEQGDYLAQVDPADDLEALFFAFAMNKSGTNYETWPSNKAFEWRLNGGADAGRLELTEEIGVICHSKVWDSAEITSTDFTGLAYPGDRENPIRFDQAVFRIGDHSDAAGLGAGDVMFITGFDFRFRRVLARGRHNSSGRYVYEPVNDGAAFDTAVLTVTFPDFGSDSAIKDFYGELLSNASKMADLQFTGAQIAAGENYALRLFFPEMKLVSPNNTGNYEAEGRLPASITLHSVLPGDALTGAEADDLAFNELFRVELINTNGAKAVV